MSNLKVNTINDASGGSAAILYGVASPPNSMGFRNRIINGEMRIDQRNNGANVSATGAFPVDRFQIVNTGTSTFTAARGTSAPAGFVNSLNYVVGTGAAVAAGDAAITRQIIEGVNGADLGWGTANAQPVTVSFWVRSSLTGTFGFVIQNYSANRSYVASYSISAANTWEYKTVTIAGDTTGTWNTDTANGWAALLWDLGTGTTLSGAAGAWSGSNLRGLTGGVKVTTTSSATFYITGVQLEAGTAATPFERRDYGRELMMCQRYFEKVTSVDGNSGFWSGQVTSGAGYFTSIPYAVFKRAAASVTIDATNLNSMGSISATSADVSGFRINGTATATIPNGYMRVTWSASAEL